MNVTAILLCATLLVCTGFSQARSFEQELEQPEAPENETVSLDVGYGYGWHRFRGNRYYFSHRAENWWTALMKCRGMRGFLVKINNWSEQNFLTRVARHTRFSFWTGGNDLAHVGHWFWAYPYSRMYFTAWNRGEPNYIGRERCVEMSRVMGYRWNNLSCDKKLHYICERRRC